jgi:hypothetical protein
VLNENGARVRQRNRRRSGIAHEREHDYEDERDYEYDYRPRLRTSMNQSISNRSSPQAVNGCSSSAITRNGGPGHGLTPAATRCRRCAT